MILGISLVVQEFHKGPRLIFRYPTEESSYFTTIESLGGDLISSNRKNISIENLIKKASSLYFSLRYLYRSLFRQHLLQGYFCSDENFAKLFRKPPSGKAFEINIGDLSLVSYPCTCPNEEFESGLSTEKGPIHQISSFNIVVASIPTILLRSLDPRIPIICQKGVFCSSPHPGLVGSRLCRQSIRR
jgi:hypothetical protein